jgi:hypothetical protein
MRIELIAANLFIAGDNNCRDSPRDMDELKSGKLINLLERSDQANIFINQNPSKVQIKTKF